jgi:hypothetical protein
MSTLTLTGGGAVRLPARPAAAEQRAASASLHLTRRGRLVVVLLAVALLLGGTLFGTRAAAAGPESAPEVERYVVAPGDTLWRLAQGVAAPGEDLRDVVQEIVLLNRMPSVGLVAGEEILLPVDR